MTEAAPSPGRTRSRNGFTLIELMVVVVIISILAAIGANAIGPYLCSGRLAEAQAYMLPIASKMRIYKTENGNYYNVAGATITEDAIKTNLGVDLRDAQNFCFVVVCNPTTIATTATTCLAAGTPDYVNTNDATAVEFEVWAILRASTGTTNVSGPNSVICTPATNKRDPTGWVKASGSGDRCRQGQVVVHRYPPPVNGFDATAGTNGNFDWLEGSSITHAMEQ